MKIEVANWDNKNKASKEALMGGIRELLRGDGA